MNESRKLCGAKLRNKDRTCKQSPMPNGRCRLHGGNAKKGIEASDFRHGRYSKYLPTDIAARYKDAWSDPEALSLMSEIMALDAFIFSEMLALKEEVTPEWRSALRQQALAILSKEAARSTMDRQGFEWRKIQNEINLAVSELVKAIAEINPESLLQAEARERIANMFEKRRRLVESEHKRQRDLEQNVTPTEVMGIARALLQAVLNNVPSVEQREAVQKEFAMILGLVPRRVAPAIPVAVEPRSNGYTNGKPLSQSEPRS